LNQPAEPGRTCGAEPPGGRHLQVEQGHARAGHIHGAGADGRRLGLALALICLYMVAEVVVGFLAHSLALLADAGHMLTDAAALGLAIWALRLARRPATATMTYGLKRAEVLSAALNGLALAAIGAAVLVGAAERLLHPAKVAATSVAVVAGVGVVVNLAATAALAGADRRRLSVAGAWAHLLSDLFAFSATLVAALVILVTGFERADALAALAVVALMARSSIELLRASCRVLLEGTPEGVSLEEIRNHMLSVPEVSSVHDLHVWVVTSDLPALSAHVVVDDACFADGSAPQVLDRLQACLAGHFDVEHSTFQLEPSSHLAHEGSQHD